MDHRLAIVLVPGDSKDPVQDSRALLERHQNLPVDSAGDRTMPKFRYKRVGGWFDGLVRGEVDQERWSTVLRMLLSGAKTNAEWPLPGFGPETGRAIESRIETDNMVKLEDVWPLAPCSIIVTKSGEWFAHPHPDQLDEQATVASAKEDEAWQQVKRALFEQNPGSLAVGWDLSWDFIAPVALHVAQSRMPRAWGSKGSLPASPGASV
jgi:hypothetical protein